MISADRVRQEEHCHAIHPPIDAVVLLLIGLLVAAPAARAADSSGGTVQLMPVVAPAGARGTVTLSNVEFEGWEYWDVVGPTYMETYAGAMTFTCKGLKPKTYYSTNAGLVKTDRLGNLSITNPHVHFEAMWWTEDGGQTWYGPTDQGGQLLEASVRSFSTTRAALVGYYNVKSLIKGPFPGDDDFTGTPEFECPLP